MFHPSLCTPPVANAPFAVRFARSAKLGRKGKKRTLRSVTTCGRHACIGALLRHALVFYVSNVLYLCIIFALIQIV